MDRVKIEKYDVPEISESENYWKVPSLKKAMPLLIESPIYFNIYTSLHLDLRAEETAAINENDIDFNEGTITIRNAVKKYMEKRVLEANTLKN